MSNSVCKYKCFKGICLSSMGVVFRQEDTSSIQVQNTFFVHGKKSLPYLLCILTVGL